MTLSDYLAERRIDDAAFAATIEVDRSSVNRMRRGKLIPGSEVLRRIVDATSGAVTPNDFFDIPPILSDAADAAAADAAPSGIDGADAGAAQHDAREQVA